jgi:hypothetical protein
MPDRCATFGGRSSHSQRTRQPHLTDAEELKLLIYLGFFENKLSKQAKCIEDLAFFEQWLCKQSAASAKCGFGHVDHPICTFAAQGNFEHTIRPNKPQEAK